METLTSRIERASTLGGSVTFVTASDAAVTVPWAELHEEAKAMAAALQARGCGRGSHVGLLGPTSRSLVTAVQATWLVGATIVVLPLPMRMSSIELFVEATRDRIHAADTTILLVDADFAPFIEERPGDPPMVVMSELVGGMSAADYVSPDHAPSDRAILQFTSGSTSEPKGVELDNQTVCANLDAIVSTTGLTVGEDTLVSWLPLYHDMGLIGFLVLPMTTGVDLVLGAPQDFLARPARWMEWISTYGGTATAGPNFSYVLATRALRSAKETLDLSRLRIALNGAEPVDPASVRAFIEAGERHNMSPGAVFPAFGMAETTIAGTFPPVGRGLAVDVVDRQALEEDRVATPVDGGSDDARELVMLGRPVPGLEIRVVEPGTTRVLADREVGELQIRGTSVTSGYYDNIDATSSTFESDWLKTGDLAYLIDGEMVMCGRIKDIIIVGGRNVFPQDVERAVGEIDGIRTGNVIAFGVEGRQGKQSMVVVAETRSDGVDELRAAVSTTVRDVVGLPAKDIMFVGPGSLPKTSSGKLQRARCREMYLERELVLAG